MAGAGATPNPTHNNDHICTEASRGLTRAVPAGTIGAENRVEADKTIFSSLRFDSVATHRRELPSGLAIRAPVADNLTVAIQGPLRHERRGVRAQLGGTTFMRARSSGADRVSWMIVAATAVSMWAFSAPATAIGQTHLPGRSALTNAWLTTGITTGSLSFESDNATVKTRLDALPVVGMGAETWIEPAVGLYAHLLLGAGADIYIPSTGQSIRYNAHVLEAGLWLRWSPSEQSPAALMGSLGVRALRQTPREQRPALLVGSTVAGPEGGFGGEVRMLDGRLCLRALLTAGVPFFVRETPRDSGDPRSFTSVGARASVGFEPVVLEPWSLALAANITQHKVEFEGAGSRAAGVYGSSVRDRLASFRVALRRRL